MFLSKVPMRGYLFLSRLLRGMTLGVRAAVFDGEGRVFLVKHSYMPGWYLPGGGVDPGETLEEAMHRELREEGGIELTAPPELLGVYLNRAMSVRDHVAVYVCRGFRQVGEPVRNMEIVDSGFFAPDKLPDDATGATRRRLAEIAGGIRTADW
jgi:8-oxo-dGTP pyrophosphatase MutT (NUDIX family)